MKSCYAKSTKTKSPAGRRVNRPRKDRKMYKVLYYKYSRYGYKRHVDIMTYESYIDLILDHDVIVKRKWEA